jgi:hypothetical protein
MSQNKEVPPTSILWDKLQHRAAKLSVLEREAVYHEIPEHLGRCPLSLAATDVAVLEEENPEVLICLAVRHCHLGKTLQLGLDDLLRCTAHKQSVEDNTRVAYTLCGVDI